MAFHIFHHFIDLPIELQVIIWKMATGSLMIDGVYLDIWCIWVGYVTPPLIWPTWADPSSLLKDTWWTRRKLMATSRLARLTVLELERREVSEVVVSGTESFSNTRGITPVNARPRKRADSLAVRREIMEEIDRRIEGVKTRIVARKGRQR